MILTLSFELSNGFLSAKIRGKSKIMKKLLTILLLIIFSFACAPRSDETSPEMAQSLLKIRGFNFTEDEFFKAIKQSDAPAVKLFLQGGVNTGAKNKTGETALTCAVVNADVPTVKILLEKVDINQPDDQGNSPLFLSLKKNKYDIFNFLLEKGADVNAVGNAKGAQNQSVLYVAVLLEKPDIVKKLLEKGANPNLADDGGAIPISEIVLALRPDMESFNLLLEKGTNVNHQEKNGSTLLIYAAKNSKMASETRQEIIKALLGKGADKRIKDKDGKTALDWAKERKNTDAVELLK